MENTLQKTIEVPAEQKKSRFNLNKLQAVVCMLASAVVSISLIAWAISSV